VAVVAFIAISGAGSPTPTSTVAPGVRQASHVRGLETAPVTIEEWADFQCPACGTFARTTEPQLVATYAAQGKVKIVYRHLAFLGQESQWAAEASECADEQESSGNSTTMMHPPTDMTYIVAIVRAPRLIVYRGKSIGAVTWTFYLVPTDDGTRLITRWRGRPANGVGEEVANAAFGTMDFVMEQKMLRGIKQRVEQQVAAGGEA
jgi:hypothetical protein